MEKRIVEKKQIDYINGVKGFACIMIMLGHYTGIYKYAESFLPNIKVLDAVINTKLSFIINESFWLYLFFVISGFLVARTQISSIKQLVNKAISRFLRLGCPILFAYIIIFFVYKVFGFAISETIDLFSNSWFQGAYGGDYSILDVVRSPVWVLLLGGSVLNSPYWVLKDMLFASVLIYVLSYAKVLLKKTFVFDVIFCCATVFALWYSNIVFACLIGGGVTYYEDVLKDLKSNQRVATFLALGSLLFYVIPRTMLSVFSFVVLIMLIPKSNILMKISSSKIACWFGKYSWGIYSFHWPMICSVGSIVLIDLTRYIGLVNAYVVAMALSVLLTILLSVPFYHIFERFSAMIVKKISNLL